MRVRPLLREDQDAMYWVWMLGWDMTLQEHSRNWWKRQRIKAVLVGLLAFLLLNSTHPASPVNWHQAAAASLPPWPPSWLQHVLSVAPVMDNIMGTVPARMWKVLGAPMCAQAAAVAKAGAGSAHAACSRLAQALVRLLLLAPVPMEPYLTQLLGLQLSMLGWVAVVVGAAYLCAYPLQYALAFVYAYFRFIRKSGLRDVETHWLQPAHKAFWVAVAEEGDLQGALQGCKAGQILGGVGVDLNGGGEVRKFVGGAEEESRGSGEEGRGTSKGGAQQQQQQQQQQEQHQRAEESSSGAKHGSIHHLAVTRRCRGLGLGSKLMHALEVYAQEQGCASLSLVTACSAAATFYSRLKYRAVRQIHTPTCTVFFMTKDL